MARDDWRQHLWCVVDFARRPALASREQRTCHQHRFFGRATGLPQQRRVLRHETRGARLVRIASDRIPQRPRRDDHQPWGCQHTLHRPHHQRRIASQLPPPIWRRHGSRLRGRCGVVCGRKSGARGGQRADDSPRSKMTSFEIQSFE